MDDFVSWRNAEENDISAKFGDDLLLPWRQVAAVVEPRVGQVWTMSALAKVPGDSRLRRRGGGGGSSFVGTAGKRPAFWAGATAETRPFIWHEGKKKFMMPEHIAVVREVKRGANISGAGAGSAVFGGRRSVAENAAEEVKNALWAVETLRLVAGLSSILYTFAPHLSNIYASTRLFHASCHHR